MKTTISLFAVALVIAGFITGCGSKETADNHSLDKWDLVATKDGVVYRINKQSGEVYLISGLSSAAVQGTENAPKTNNVVEWAEVAHSNLNGIKTHLKANWRNGNIQYIFTASLTNASQAERILQSASAESCFIVRFYDEDEFVAFTLPIKVKEMMYSSAADNTISLIANASANCNYENYKLFKSWSVSKAGF